MTRAYELSVVIAVQYAQQNLTEIMQRIKPGSYPQVEFIFCATAADPDTPVYVAGLRNVSVMVSPPGSLIPVLWKEGILAAHANKVALSTAHCLPETSWVQRLLDEDMSAAPAVGGVITNDPSATASAWAIYLLRYISFSPPQKGGNVTEIAADNSLYRREDILRNIDLLEDGFWEPSFHHRFRQAGLSLRMNPDISVMHRNSYTTRQFFQQRLAHGKAFGKARAASISANRRRLLILLSPVLPLMFLVKIIRRTVANGMYMNRLLMALPWLLIFLTGWGLGEAMGYLAAQQVQLDKQEGASGPGQ